MRHTQRDKGGPSGLDAHAGRLGGIPDTRWRRRRTDVGLRPTLRRSSSVLRSPPACPPLVATAAGHELSVLVIEDDSHLLRSLRDILGRRGYKPLTAQSAREGLALVEQELPAVALVDLKLPDMDGVEVIDRLTALSQLTQTIVLTGNATIESALHALRQRTYDYLVKPVPPEKLLTTIDRAGERWQRRRAEEALRQSEERAQLLLEHISDVRHGRRRRARLPLRQPVGPPPARLPAERAGRPAVPRRGPPRGRRRDRNLPPRRASPRRPDAGAPAAGAAAQRRLAPARDRRDQPRGPDGHGRRPADRPRHHRALAHGAGAAAGAADGQHRPARRRRGARLQQHPHRHPRLLRDPARRRAAGQRLAARPRGDPEGGAARRLAHPPAAGVQPAADARPEDPRSGRGGRATSSA